MILQGDAKAIPLADNSVDAIVTDPPYGLKFMGQEWDRFATGRAAKYAKGGSLISEEQIAERRGKGGAGPSYVNRPAKRCSKCGKQAWSGSPCKCPEPEWVMDNSPLHAAQSWHYAWAIEALRVLKPGGHLLAFGGTRTHHRLMCALEDAGWEIRDCLMWLYGSGFPKSLDVSKAIDKAAGVEREVIGKQIGRAATPRRDFRGGKFHAAADLVNADFSNITAPGTDAAKDWDGWGTALKPAWEPIILARKPLSERNVAANVLKWGTGALNIDACRIDGPKGDGVWGSNNRTVNRERVFNDSPGDADYVTEQHPAGRWPANVILDEESAARLDEQTGERTSGRLGVGHASGNTFGIGNDDKKPRPIAREYGNDTGGASRFFYCAKADRGEREEGLRGVVPCAKCKEKNSLSHVDERGRTVPCVRNDHPTVKPLAIMEWLCRLITPPQGLILDLFMGSGSTGIAALRCGFRFLGIDKEGRWVSIASWRIMGDAPLLNRPAL